MPGTHGAEPKEILQEPLQGQREMIDVCIDPPNHTDASEAVHACG